MRFVVVLLAICVSSTAVAHDSLEHTAARLDEVLLEEVSVVALIERAEVHRELQEFAEANSLLAHAADLEPDNPAVCLAHAENHAQFEHHEEVVQAVNRYAERGGGSLRGLWLRASARAELGLLEAAQTDCDALAEFDTNVEVVLLCAHVAAGRGEGSTALARLEEGYHETGAVVVLLAAYEQALSLGEFESASQLAADGATLGVVNTLWLLRQAYAVGLAGDESLAFALRVEALEVSASALERRDSCLNRVNWLQALATVEPDAAETALEDARTRCQGDPELRRIMSVLADSLL